MTHSLWTTLQSALAQTLVAAAWQGLLLGAVAACVLSALRHARAATRHTVGMLLLVAMLVVPMWHLAGMLAASTDPVSEAASAAPLAANAQAPHPLAWWPLPGPATVAWRAPGWLAWVWCVGVLVMAGRLAGGWWWLQSLERQALPSTLLPVWQRRVDHLRHALGIARPVVLRLWSAPASPFTARAWRPVIWLPIALLTRLTPEQIDALIAHELAHIRRLDWLWNGLQCAVETLLFFHPAVWWLSRQVRIERECACDQLAASACGDTVVVAEALASLGRLAASPPTTLAQAARPAHPGQLLQRVTLLLAAAPQPRPRWGMAAGLVALACAGAAWASQVVAVVEAPAAAPTSADPSADPSAPAQADAPASTDDADPWWTQVGESRRIRFRQSGRVHDLHVWVGPDGQRHETYRVDGRLTTITPPVRAWLDAQQRPPLVPATPDAPQSPATPDAPTSPDDAERWPPLPPVPPVPPTPTLPPLPPLPPEPPRISESAAYQAVSAAAQTHEALVRRLGSPIQLKGDCGPCRIDDRHASLNLTASGPRGQVGVHAEGRLIDGQWRITSMELRPSLAQQLGLTR